MEQGFPHQLPVLENSLLHMGQGCPQQLPVLENSGLHAHVIQVVCDDGTIFRALLVYKIAFIWLSSGRKQ